ncbi:MAG: hypothetical protein Q9217_007065 [Psora testacea]
MPLYCYAHRSSGHAAHAYHQHDRALSSAPSPYLAKQLSLAVRLIPLSMTVGYIFPSIAMCWPTLPGRDRQFAVAIWQNFPLWVALVQGALQQLISREEEGGTTAASAGTDEHPKRTFRTEGSEETRELVVDAAAWTYRIALIVSTTTHLLVALPILAVTIFPDLSLLSAGSDPAAKAPLQWKSFLLPPMWTSTKQISSMAEGAWNFLRYDHYIGTTAALIWAGLACYDGRGRSPKSKRKRAGISFVLKILVWGVIGGPGALILVLMANRDVRSLWKVKKWQSIDR